jgi:very-short-patch-repair endonuclease
LAVEIDGGIHESQKEYDAARQAVLEREGLRFVRVSAEELETNPEILATRILKAIAPPTKTVPLPSSPSRSERVERGRG